MFLDSEQMSGDSSMAIRQKCGRFNQNTTAASAIVSCVENERVQTASNNIQPSVGSGGRSNIQHALDYGMCWEGGRRSQMILNAILVHLPLSLPALALSHWKVSRAAEEPTSSWPTSDVSSAAILFQPVCFFQAKRRQQASKRRAAVNLIMLSPVLLSVELWPHWCSLLKV